MLFDTGTIAETPRNNFYFGAAQLLSFVVDYLNNFCLFFVGMRRKQSFKEKSSDMRVLLFIPTKLLNFCSCTSKIWRNKDDC